MGAICFQSILSNANFVFSLNVAQGGKTRKKGADKENWVFGGKTGLKPLKVALKNVFIDRKINADSRNPKFRRFFQFLADFLTFQK